MNHLFKTNDLIYESANSVIFRGIRLKDQHPVVLKKLNRSDPSPIEISRFRREFSIAERFRHPGIIKVYDIIETDEGALFIAMEDCGGESVDRYFDRFQDLTFEEQLNMACRIAECIEQIHALKIIHMDINPTNIIWCPDVDLLKIIDFGISTELSSEIEFVNLSSLEGTLAYMSPEQTGRMNRPIDYRTDLYSFGVTLYELFTGSLPFSNDDPLSLIHSHIAVIPTQASRINKNLPEAVSQIIAKLMAKDADERYQSAAGVKHDLQYCIDCMAKGVAMRSFKIASNDVSTVFKVPQKLYFREQERLKIANTFDSVCRSGKGRLTLVSGHSGVGKSVLVKEIVKHVITKNAFYLSGKFGEMEHAIPHMIIIQAFSGLFDQLMSDTDERLTYWKERINDAVYPNGHIITDVIPIAKHIIKDQPPLLQLEPQEAQNRFNQCFLNLIQVFADSQHPLVLFLDDLQWADNAIFSLLELTLLKEIKYLYVIGAYRSNEVTDAHPLNGFIHALSHSDTHISRINLPSFDLVQTTRFVIDAFGREEQTARELAEVLFLKTRGNPFFLIQSLNLLYTSGAIHADGSGNWTWESSSAEGLMDDVVDLMIAKMGRLSDESQHIIKTAACIDSQVSLDKLIIASGVSQDTIVPCLSDLASQGFLTASSTFKYIDDAEGPLAVHFRFLHDRIRQAAYHLAADSDRIHLDIGLRFWEKLDKSGFDVSVFDVAKQCNKVIGLLPHEKRIALAELNLIAGLKAKDTSAWNQAFHYFSSGLRLLKGQDWHSAYKLAYDLHCGCAETALLISNFDRVDTLCETILRNARSLVDKCFVWNVQIMALIAQGKPVDAVDAGLKTLSKLGIKIKSNPSRLFIVLSLLKTKLLIRGISNSYANHKKMMSPEHLATYRVLIRIASAAYICGSTTFVPIALKSIQMFVKYGYAPDATFALAGGGVLLGILGDHSSAHKFGQFALSFIDREDTKPVAARTVYITTAFISIYNVPYKDLLPNLLKHYKVGLETGDIEYAAFNIYCYCYLRFISGDTLTAVNLIMSEYENSVKQQNIVSIFFILYQQLIQNLLGESKDPLVLAVDACDEHKIIQHMEGQRNEIGLFDFYTKKTMLGYFFYDYKVAIDASEKAMQYIQAAKIKHDVPIALFYQTLTIFALLKSNTAHVDSSFRKILSRNIRKTKKWSIHSPSSFSHKYILLKAELSFIKGNHVKAEKYYQESVRLARDSGIIQELAVALELLAFFYKHRGYEDIYHLYMKKAFKTYRKWGAIAKCRVLRQKYKDAFDTNASKTNFRVIAKSTIDPAASTLLGSTTQQTNLANIDLLSVIKASHMISSEMNINALSKKLLKIVLENAGAQNGLLIFYKKNSREIESIYCIDERGQVFLNVKTDNKPIYPENLINYVARTRNHVVIGDAVDDNCVHSKDTYIQTYNVRSALCMPLIRNDMVIAILYLDNSVTPDAFNEGRIKVLELLTAQAAISIENANLYKIQIEKKLAESKAAAKSKFLAHMSHEIRTPLNTILGYSELIKESGDTPNRDYIKNIISSGKLLLSVVDDVLDLSRIEKGLISLNIKPMSFRSLFEELEYQYLTRCKEKGLSFYIRLDEFLSNNMVETDELRIKQVLLNLLNNALKYTESGFLKLEAQAIEKKAQSVTIMCTVSDSGIGISDTSIIFDEFEQLPHDQLSYGGVGLGLAIVKKLVEVIGGVITVDSSKGKGSKFSIQFSDLKLASEGQDDKHAPLIETIRFHEANLLVVDDNHNNLKLLKDYFADQPFKIYTADNGRRAQKLIHSTDFAAILLDLKIPVINGAELTELLKTDARYSSIPVIIITADVTDESKQKLVALKCDGYLLKPIRKHTLFNTLKQFLSHDVIYATHQVERQSPISDFSIPDNLGLDVVQRISDDLKSLKHEKWDNLEKTMIIGDICSFAQDVREIGDKHGFDELIQWGARLNQSASNFDVSKTELIFSKFPEIISLFDNANDQIKHP